MEQFKIENLSFSYPQKEKFSLNNINLSIKKGEYITVCGKSGSGKSTLLNHLKSVLTPFGKRTGKIFFNGVPLNEVGEREQCSSIGFVMQNPDHQIVTDKVWHELAFGLENLGEDQKVIRMRVAEMANYFGIEEWFHRDVSTLSGGQKQLLNLAAIMAMQPNVLILDEPTSQLDPIAASDFLNTVRKINLELGTTVIITEHRLENIFYCSDRVVVMENGEIISDNTPNNTGEVLKQRNSDMLLALPTPVRIFYDLQTIGTAPLTVREGRNWLTDYIGQDEVEFKCVKEKKSEDVRNDPVIEMKEVWFRYEKDSPDVLADLSVKVPEGRIFAVVGGNGAGKSTFLKTVCGIHKPYSGKIKILGKDISKYKGNELFLNCIAMLPQDPTALFACKNIYEDLLEMLPQRLSETEKKEKIKKVSGVTDISGLLESHPFDLSGGEQQRAALAKVLLTEPRILILDEPTKGMDAFFKQKFACILRTLINSGVTILMVSHDIEFCAEYADLVSMFFDHTLLTINTPGKFFSENSFYTTAANRMSRHLFTNAVTEKDVVMLCRENLKQN